jgi:hypothetical protein
MPTSGVVNGVRALLDLGCSNMKHALGGYKMGVLRILLLSVNGSLHHLL